MTKSPDQNSNSHRDWQLEHDSCSIPASLRLESAAHYFGRAIKIASDFWRPPFAHHALAGLAQLLAAQGGDLEGAYRLRTFVLNNPASWGWSKDSTAALLALLEADLSPESITAIQE